MQTLPDDERRSDDEPGADRAFLEGGGAMGALIREKDWSSTALGPPEGWPAELRTVIRIMLTTNHPVFVFWGPGLRCFYNDAYSRSLGPEKHPSALGAPGREVWDEIWDVIGPQIDGVMSRGEATWYEDALVPITRYGRREDVYWTYSYSPIDEPDAPNGIGGVLVICNETTRSVLDRRRREAEADEARTRVQEVHHRVKNNLATIKAMVNLEARDLSEEAARRPLKRIASRLDSFATVYELLLGTGEGDRIDLGAYCGRLCAAMKRMEAGSIACDVTLETDLYACIVPADQALRIGAVLIELLQNAYAHAFPAGRTAGRIRVELRCAGAEATLSVRDDGVGKAASEAKEGEAKERSTGVGTLLVRQYVRQVGGTLDEQSAADGTQCVFRFPVTPAADEGGSAS